MADQVEMYKRFDAWLREEAEWDGCLPDFVTITRFETGYDKEAGYPVAILEGINSIGSEMVALFDDGGYESQDELTVRTVNSRFVYGEMRHCGLSWQEVRWKFRDRFKAWIGEEDED